jgi:hypothetical protein
VDVAVAHMDIKAFDELEITFVEIVISRVRGKIFPPTIL